MREQQAQFEAILENLEPIGTFISGFMIAADLREDYINDFEVAADEHISNLIEHAFCEAPGHFITIICRDDESKTQVMILDKSQGFDPRQYSLPDLEEMPIYEIPPGGFGNYFICKLMDDIEYIHRPYEKNTLILTKSKQT